ncbi:MAG TPA: hypothetical protein VGD71_12315 [Kribbella sp.]
MAEEAIGVLELASELAKTSPLPLMLTGGITRRETAEKVLANNVAVIGMGSALAVAPDLPNRWREHLEATATLKPVAWLDKSLASTAGMAMVRYQLRRIARGRNPAPGVDPAFALVADQVVQRHALCRYRRWLKSRAKPQDAPNPTQVVL